MSAERTTIQLEQLQDSIKEQNRLVLLELEPSAQERQDLIDLAVACRDGIDALCSATLAAEYERLLASLGELNVDTSELLLSGPVNESKPRDLRKVRFSDISEVYEPPAPRERTSEETPYSDDPRVQFDHNNTLMMDQDVRLEALGSTVRRTRQMGTDIGTELNVQDHMLSDLEAQTDSTQERLDTANTRVGAFNRKAREGSACLVITTLTLILFILLVLF